MNNDELATIESELRGILRTLELNWVIDEVDRTFEEGVAELRHLRRRTAPSYSSDDSGVMYESVAISESLRSASFRKPQGSPVITTRDMTSTERVLQLIDTVAIILVELPAAEAQSLETASQITGSDDITITFVESKPNQSERRFRLQADRILPETRSRLLDLLKQLRDEVAR